MPLSPTIALGSLDVDAVVVSGDVREGLQAQRSGVVFVSAPGSELDLGDGLVHFGIGSEGEARPLVDDLLRAELGIPGEATEAIEVGLR